MNRSSYSPLLTSIKVEDSEDVTEGASEIHTSIFKIQNLCCSAEVGLIKCELDPDDVPGVINVSVDVLGRMATVRHDISLLSANQIVELLNAADLGASLVQQINGEDLSVNKEGSAINEHFRMKLIIMGGATVYSAFVLACFLFLGHHHPSPTDELIIQIVASVGISAGVIYMFTLASWRNLFRHGKIDMHMLMGLAAIGTVILEEYVEGYILVYSFLIADMIQIYALHRVNLMIASLLVGGEPSIAYSPDNMKPLPLDTIEIGTTLCVRAGERVPLDGTITTGQVLVDESSLTGESVGVKKVKDDMLMSGTVIQRGYCEFKTTCKAKESTWNRVADIMHEARGANMSSFELLINKFASYFTPIVLLISVLVPLIAILINDGKHSSEWIKNGLVLLVISCPCALVLSSPVVIATSMAAASRFGAIIKGGQFLETLSRADVFLFDKTGTLTEGRFTVNETLILSDDVKYTEEKIWEYCAAVERQSSHPLAHALVNQSTGCVAEYHKKEREELMVHHFKETDGGGVYGKVDGHNIFVGNERMIPLAKLYEEIGDKATLLDDDDDHKVELLSSDNINKLNLWKRMCRTCVFICIDGIPVLMAGLEDVLRPCSKPMVDILYNELHIQSIILTGDNEGVATAVAEKLGLIGHMLSDVKPSDKLSYVQKLQNSTSVTGNSKTVVAMVGDGVNDAPALAMADVGIALGKAGAALSVEAAGIILLNEDLLTLPKLIYLARYCQRVIKQNLSLAFIIKLITLILALLGMVPLYIAVLADVGSLLLVLLNGLKPLWLQDHSNDDCCWAPTSY